MLLWCGYYQASAEEKFHMFIRKTGLPPQCFVLKDGTHGHWLGESAVDKVMVYFHGMAANFKNQWSSVLSGSTGGGYFLPADDSHFALTWSLVSELTKKHGKCFAGLVSYGEFAVLERLILMIGEMRVVANTKNRCCAVSSAA
jgi:hypothetical protein